MAAVTTIEPNDPQKYKLDILWRNIFLIGVMHIGGLYGYYLLATLSVNLSTFIWALFTGMLGGLGVTAGSHRLWSHRSYKAKAPLRFMLTYFHTMAFQMSIKDWVKTHRNHHKFCDTDGDPHNTKRGIFFCHIGWLFCNQHPEVKSKAAIIDRTDLDEDAFVNFQHDYYSMIAPIVSFAVPTLVPYYFWGESLWYSWNIAALSRICTTMHIVSCINSVGHTLGAKPYDKSMGAVENYSLSLAALGEGWHNFHHVFPWDYKAEELGIHHMSVTTAFIDFCAKIGWAYDLKSVSEETVRKRAARTGDGTYKSVGQEHTHLMEGEKPIWGWGDKDNMYKDDIKGI